MKMTADNLLKINSNDEYLQETSGDDIDRVKALYAEIGGDITDITQIEKSKYHDNKFIVDSVLYLVVTDDELHNLIMGEQDENGDTIALLGYGYNTEEMQQIVNGVTYLIYKKE